MNFDGDCAGHVCVGVCVCARMHMYVSSECAGREGARERGSEGARERGSEGARERGSEGGREAGRGREREREREREGRLKLKTEVYQEKCEETEAVHAWHCTLYAPHA